MLESISAQTPVPVGIKGSKTKLKTNKQTNHPRSPLLRFWFRGYGAGLSTMFYRKTVAEMLLLQGRESLGLALPFLNFLLGQAGCLVLGLLEPIPALELARILGLQNRGCPPLGLGSCYPRFSGCLTTLR